MKLYLDTSVFSAYYDERTPERMRMTRDFWRVLERHEKLCSDLTIEELGQARSGLREKLLGLAQGFTVINLTDEMRELAKLYVREGLVPSKYFADAFHIAAAVLGGADILVSWNFKHLVIRSTRLLVNYINANQGLRTIEILAPPEV
ncbi:MAG TPA: type II toxin-antitoxin system VapC family toxin [Candidatus Acetothermia bacterium]|nr:type II toxin-antitoxin system VapC family toxin [Candidatus Acetothermia bacterium]